jgi:hypothetical protein
MKKIGAVRFGIFVLAFVFAMPVFAAKVSGQLKTSKSVIKPTAVAAFPVRSKELAYVDTSLKWVTALIVAEGTMNVAEALQDIEPLSVLHNQDGMWEKNYITFLIRPDGYVEMHVLPVGADDEYIDSTKDKTGKGGISAQSLEATFTENSPNRLAGRIRTTKVAKTTKGETYELDVYFDTPVTQRPVGKKLSADGGEPGKALLQLLAAVKSKNWKGVQAGVSSKILESNTKADASEADNLISVLKFISWYLPTGKRMKILSGEEFSDRAILEVQAQWADGPSDSMYIVKMLKEPSGWRYDLASVYPL